MFFADPIEIGSGYTRKQSPEFAYTPSPEASPHGLTASSRG